MYNYNVLYQLYVVHQTTKFYLPVINSKLHRLVPYWGWKTQWIFHISHYIYQLLHFDDKTTG